MKIESYFCNGYDIKKTFYLLDKAINKIKKNFKPIFIEFSTYRWLEHCGPNDDTILDYRSIKELNSWKKRDPIAKLEKELISSKKNLEKKINKLKKNNKVKIKKAFDYAIKSKLPKTKDAFKDIYA